MHVLYIIVFSIFIAIDLIAIGKLSDGKTIRIGVGSYITALVINVLLLLGVIFFL